MTYTVVYNKFHFGKKDFKSFIGYKDNKEIRHLCMFSPETSIYKRWSDLSPETSIYKR